LDYLHGNLSLLRRTGLDAEQRAALQGVEQSTSEVLLALEQLRDLTHSSAEEPAQSFRFDLERTLSWVCRQFRGPMKSNGLDFSLSVDPETPFSLLGDARRLRSVLVWLLDNSLQFASTGMVSLRVAPTTPPTASQVHLRFEVIDSGAGLPQELRRTFLSGDLCSEAAPSLTIVGRWLESMDSRLELEESSAGCHFAFDLTFGRDLAPEQSHVRSSLAGKRVLIVDQSLASRRLLEKSLEHVGACYVSCSDLAGALAFLESGELPDAIILDSELAGDGQANAAEALRAYSAQLILLVPLAVRGDGPRFREMGCRAYLVKPLQQEQVLEALSAALAVGPAQPFITTHSLEEATKLKSQVLLLAEEAMLSRQAEHLLCGAGHEVTRLQATCEAVRGLTADSKFDLVLIDRSGCRPEIIAELDKRCPDLPRIGLIPPDETLPAQLVTQGLDELLYIPLRTWELSQIILRWAGRELQRAAFPPPVEEAPPIKISVLTEATDGDSELQKEMIEAFRDDLKTSFAKIERALERGSLRDVSAEGHALKGSAPYFGADRFADLADTLEEASKRCDMEQTKAAFEACRAEYQKILTFFETFTGS
jgi:CheY-like chemotaxis protein/HPt (histidine-containing phosphotransfer) domain-containing protein